MAYVPPFSVLKQAFEFKSTRSGLMATATYENLVKVIQSLLQNVDVDEDWYEKTYPDIAEAVRDGRVKSARHHFLDNGYIEGRMPAPMRIDEAWYLQQYPDIAEAIKVGTIESAEKHFHEIGYFEGRMPHAPE
jgi:hypothetical protein